MPHQQFNVSDGVHFITCLINKNKLEGVKLEESDIIKMGNFSIKTVTVRGKEQQVVSVKQTPVIYKKGQDLKQIGDPK